MVTTGPLGASSAVRVLASARRATERIVRPARRFAVRAKGIVCCVHEIATRKLPSAGVVPNGTLSQTFIVLE